MIVVLKIYTAKIIIAFINKFTLYFVKITETKRIPFITSQITNVIPCAL